MSILVTCSHCEVSFRVKDQLAGKRGKCPQCLEVLEVPAATASAPSPAMQRGPAVEPQENPAGVATKTAAPAKAAPAGPAAATAAESSLARLAYEQREQAILNAFEGRIEPVKAPLSYRLGVLLVSLVMITLPLIYIALIALVCVAVYYHAVNHTAMLGSARGRAAIFALLAYAAPMVIGGILVVFMIKPLFARSGDESRRRSLTRDGEPLLFAFVDRLCAAVGAPPPKRIDVDGQINASASFRRGWLSMLGSGDLVLTIGMPLVAGLSLQQFAGVLAHEFGHFAQGAGMRLTYVIRSISWWFTRVVYERDEWDEWLARTAKEMDLRISWILYLSLFFVWLTRKILWVLMMIGHAVGGYLLREMEFDADRHEARLAGSDVFESTCRQLFVLNVAWQGAQADLSAFYRDGRLGDDLPRLIVHNVSQIPADAHAKINAAIDESTTGLLDTHPADRDRIASAHAEKSSGIFRAPGEARALFRFFEQISKNVTWDFYRENFGSGFNAASMTPLDELLEQQNREAEAQKAAQRYLQGAFAALRPLRLPSGYLSEPQDPRSTLAQVKERRKQLQAGRKQHEADYKEYDEADTKIIHAQQVISLLKVKLRPKGELAVPTDDITQARAAATEAERLQRQLEKRMEPFEDAAGQRLYAALQLLHHPSVARRLDDAQSMRRQCEDVLPALNLLNTQHASWLRLRNQHAVQTALWAHLQDNGGSELLQGAIIDQMRLVYDSVRTLREALQNVQHPLDHAKGKMTLGQYVLAQMPGSDEPGAIYEAAEEMGDKYISLYARLAGRLAVIAERVEQSVGLVPLEE